MAQISKRVGKVSPQKFRCSCWIKLLYSLIFPTQSPKQWGFWLGYSQVFLELCLSENWWFGLLYSGNAVMPFNAKFTYKCVWFRFLYMLANLKCASCDLSRWTWGLGWAKWFSFLNLCFKFWLINMNFVIYIQLSFYKFSVMGKFWLFRALNGAYVNN